MPCSGVQALGAWDEAVRLAEKSDSINMKATHFRYAQHLEAVGDYSAAIKHYQLSDTHRQLTHSLTHSPTHPLTHSLTHYSLTTQSLTQVYLSHMLSSHVLHRQEWHMMLLLPRQASNHLPASVLSGSTCSAMSSKVAQQSSWYAANAGTMSEHNTTWMQWVMTAWR